MLRFVKHLVGVLVVFVIAGCTGGGCSSGCSCGGVTPLAEGFDASRRIENAASVRLTDSGITFLEDNVGTLAGLLIGEGGAGLTFEVPSFSQDLLVANAEFCPDGPNPNSDPPECIAEVDLASADLSVDPADPHNIQVTGPLPFRIQALPVRITWGWCPLCFEENLDIVLNEPKDCPGDDQPYKNLALNIDVSVEIDPDQGHSRYGYSRVRFVDFSVSQDDILAGLEYCGGGLTPAILDALDGFLIGFLYDSLIGTLTEQIDEALCQQANPDLNPPCPTGTTNVDGVCRYGSDSSAPCASIILGMDGNIDLGGLLASFSPGTRGAFDFLFAAGGHTVRTDGSGHHWGDLNPIDQGATLGMYGGTEPTPISGCVPLADVELPTGIPIPDELVGNTLPDWPSEIEGPHFGLALSERFVNYALAQMYNSGALCLGITADALGDAVPLTTALVGVGLGLPEPKNSLDELGWQKSAVPLAIVLRPQQPPHIEVGNGTDLETDPLLRLTMPQVSFDFYAWSLDRYIRVFTATMDLDVPVNLEVTPEGLLPVIEDLGVENATVTNSALLRKDPDQIATALQDLLGGLVGSFLGDALPPIDVNGLLADLGMELQIPLSDGGSSPGLRKLTKDSDDFLGIFATLAIADPPNSGQAAPPMASHEGAPSDTTAVLTSLHVDPAGLTAAGRTRDNGPRATLRLGSTLDDGRHAIEWQYKIDTQPWHPFTRERHLVVDDNWLRVQGRHVVKVRSRVVGDVNSLDPEPAEVVVIVDVDEPWVGVTETPDGRWAVQVADNVSGPDRIHVRLRLGWEDGDEIEWSEWSTWTAADGLEAVWPEDAEIIEVEATDEDGNIGTVTQELIRGRGAADGSGCECSLAPEPTGSRGWLGWLLGGTLGLGLWARRRRREPRPDRQGPRPEGATQGSRGRKVATHAVSALTVVLLAGLPAGCSCEEDAEVAAGCRGRGDCEVLTPGLIGAYSSAAVAPDGTVWVAGYLEANWDLEVNLSWGDLVVGRLEDGEVAWKVIDGVPAEPAVDPEVYDPKGFRGGQTEPGDDVGLWTSIAIDSDGRPGVAYYDATHAALKYAHAGDGWSATVVQAPADLGDIGRYAKLLFLNGQPVIAYLFIEPGADGAIRSGVRIARGSSPGTDAQWSFEDVVVNENSPCRAHLCGPNTQCTAVEGLCAPESNDCGDCGSGEECVSLPGGPQCAAVYTKAKNDTYPDALGLYVSAAPRPDGGIGLAFYDRVLGNVMVASPQGNGWASIVVDGAQGDANTGDMGVGTSLAIDSAGNYHLAYVDGLAETLDYVMVEGGTTPGTPEIVDDGLGAPDGHHIVGDDSNIMISQSGDVRITYQDASSGQLRLAVGTPSGTTHDWTRNVIEQEGFAGAFSKQILVGGTVQIVNWWRVASPLPIGNVRIVTP